MLLVWGTIGNWAGSMFNYGVGRLGKMEWIERYLHIKKEKLDKAQHFMGERGAFLPIIGTAICITLGLMRANPTITAISVLIGKLIRYGVIAYGTAAVI